MKRIVRILLLLMILHSCKVEITENPGGYVRRPVLIAVLDSDSGMAVRLGENQPAFGSKGAVNIDNATGEIRVGGSKQAILASLGQGRYAANLSCAEGSKVNLLMQWPGYSVDVTDSVPAKVQWMKADTATVISFQSSRYFRVEAQLEDPAAGAQFYRISMLLRTRIYRRDAQGNITDSSEQTAPLEISGNSLPFIRNSDNSYNQYELLFTDETFNGVVQKLQFGTTELIRNNPDRKPLYVDVVLESLTPALYRYFNSLNAHIYHQADLISTPGKVEGNLQGMYGVFGISSRSVRRFGF